MRGNPKDKKKILGPIFGNAKTIIIISTIQCCMFLIQPCLWGEETLKNDVKTPVHESIEVRQKTQKEADKWEEERLRLQAKFDLLTKENEGLSNKVETLKKEASSRKSLNESLVQRERESRQVAEEIVPFTRELFNHIKTFVESDVPFLQEERKERMGRLNKIINDMEIGIAEKLRKTMEALFVEAEYGNTIEVYQDKITLNKEEILGNIFRLGRISLFFLTLDQETAAYFSVAEKSWSPLDKKHIPAIHAAIEMGRKQRPIELLCLPVGRLSAR